MQTVVGDLVTSVFQKSKLYNASPEMTHIGGDIGPIGASNLTGSIKGAGLCTR
jgi:hypothetical protein